MARRSDHSREEIREMALNAAEQLVMEHGYEYLSARKVASAIGYTVGTLYLVFDNLDDLITQVNGHTLDRLYQRMVDDQVPCPDAHDCLLQLGQTYIQFAIDDPHRWSMVFDHRNTEANSIPDWYQTKIARMFTLVEEGLKPLASHRSADDIDQATRALWGGVHGICILALTDNLGIAGVDSAQDLTRSLMSNYLKGFITQ